MIQAGDFRIQQSNAERNIANFLTFLVPEKNCVFSLIVCTNHCSSIRLSAYDPFQLEKFIKSKENCTDLILYDRRIENLAGIH